MDWKLALTTFGAVFLAELGDKTQIATFGLAAEGRSKLAVFVGSSTALIATSLIAVLAGALLAKAINPAHLQRAAGVLFIVLGVWTLVRG